MTHGQMIDMGFNFNSQPKDEQSYSIGGVCYINKKDIKKMKPKDVLVYIYKNGKKSGEFEGRLKTKKELRDFLGVVQNHHKPMNYFVGPED